MRPETRQLSTPAHFSNGHVASRDMELNLFSGDEELSEPLDEELSPLEYTRRHGLCKPYNSERPALDGLHAPSDDTFYQDLWDPSHTRITNDLSGLMKERLSVTKDTAVLLRAIQDLREAPSDPVTLDGRRWILSLKQELPVLRTDHELDVLTFGSTAVPDLNNLAIPSEVVDEENDEGLEWPAKYFTYPAKCSDRIKAEKIAVSRDVLLYLSDATQDAYSAEDAKNIIVESLQYKPVSEGTHQNDCVLRYAESGATSADTTSAPAIAAPHAIYPVVAS